MILSPGSLEFGSSFIDLMTPSLCSRIAAECDTPCRVYFRQALVQSARFVQSIPHAFGLTVRFAMKANPLTSIIRTFHDQGLHIDASSQYEVTRALEAGIPANHIQLTAQEWPRDDAVLQDFHRRGVILNPCSLLQFKRFAALFPGSEVGFRINPGLGSGGTNRTNTGGVSSSFGIWHETLSQVFEMVKESSLKVTRLHSHIGSGSDIAVWERCAELTLGIAAQIVKELPKENSQLSVVNLGGGYKVARVADEKHTDLHQAFQAIKEKCVAFSASLGRSLQLEIEPGTYLVAHAGALLCRVQDQVDTGSDGYSFLKVDSGMTELLRPSLYGSQHDIRIVSQEGSIVSSHEEYVIVGHCCESGDIFTPAPGSPEELKPRALPRAEVGDFVIVGGAGAYAEGFSVDHYNSFPAPACVMIDSPEEFTVIRRRRDFASS